MRTNEKEFATCFQGKAVFKVSIYIWFIEDWIVILDFIVLKVGLLWFEFKASSLSMFIPMGREIL